MKYSGIKTDENLRFEKCPVCGNDEFSYHAEFCRICGSTIVNYCQDFYDQNEFMISSGCGNPNPGNARFCEVCGNPTLLYKFLTHWEDEMIHSQKYEENNEDFYEDDLDLEDNLNEAFNQAFKEFSKQKCAHKK